MSLSTGRGPLSGRPAGRFTAPVPEGVAYIEPFRRRVRGVKDGQTVVDSERVLLVHRAGRPPAYAFPAGDVSAVPAQAEPDSPGYVSVGWDAADAWFEEDEQVFGHARNPYHRVDCLRSGRRLRVEAAGVTLVDTTETLAVYETALEPRLYVDPRLVRTDAAVAQRHPHLLPLQGHGQLLDGPRRRRRARGRRLELRGPAARVDAAGALPELRRDSRRRPSRPAGRCLLTPKGELGHR